MKGVDLRDQLAWARRRSHRDRSDPAAVQQVLFGVTTTSTIERALRTDRSSGRWEPALRVVPDFLSVLYNWPVAFLVDSSGRTSGQAVRRG